VKAASSPAKSVAKGTSSPAAGSVAKAAEKSVPTASSTQEGQGIAKLLAEKIVEMFGGGHVPTDSTPVAGEPAGIQQLLGFSF